MSNKTIANFSLFVIFTGLCPLFFSGCSFVSSEAGKRPAESSYGQPNVVGTIKSADITESSGLAASPCQNNVFWTHNDSGDDAFIFAINASGDNLGTWKIPNAQNIDWEDIAANKDQSGKCFIYIGEIGDNKSKRHEHAVYRVPEPLILPENADTTRQNPLLSADPDVIRFSYPDYDQDAETLMVHPKTGEIYVITKRVSGPAAVYRLKPDFNNEQPQTAQLIAAISVPAVPNGFLTGGDISPDGRRVIICDYTQAYEFVLRDNSQSFDEIWKQTPEPIDLGKRKIGESVCYSVDATSIFATSEGNKSPVFEVKRRK
ncbi:MAG: hypothetical protein ABIO36_05580 [Pyrinomonadaceae bacterium]